MADTVREPIQVYLSSDERAALDRAASELGVSRSEVLRRGVDAIAARARWGGSLAALSEIGAVLPPTDMSGRPPPSAPVAPLEQILEELARDRERG